MKSIEKKLLELRSKQLESDKVNNAKIADLKKKTLQKLQSLEKLEKQHYLNDGCRINDKTGAIIGGEAFSDGAAKKLMNTAISTEAEIGTANAGTYSQFTQTAEYANLLSFIQNEYIKYNY